MGSRFIFRGIWWCGVALGMACVLRGADDAAKFPPPEPWQVAGIRAALLDPSPVVRANAMLLTKDWDWTVLRLQAAEVLPLLQDGESEVRMGALFGLRQLGPEEAAANARALVPLIMGDAGANGMTARRMLKDLNRAGVHAVMREIAPNLMYADRGTKDRVLEAMIECSRNAAPFARLLLPLLRDRESEVRLKAAQTLGQMQLSESDPSTAPAVVPELLRLLDDPEIRVRAAAVYALRYAGAQHSQLVGLSLQPLIHSKDPHMRNCVVWALGGLNQEAAHLGTHALLPLLEDPDPSIRSDAIKALGSLGRVAAPIVAGGLLALLKDDSDVVELRDEPLQPVSSPENVAVPQVVTPVLLHQRASTQKRRAALEALAQMGDEARPYIRGMPALLRDQDPEMRAAAAMALWQIGKGTSNYLHLLLPLVQDADAEVRRSAVFALSGMGPESAPVLVKTLLPLLKSTEVKMISAVTQVFWSMRAQAAPMYADVLPAFKEASRGMQLEVMRVLALVGADAVPYMQVMLPLLHSPDAYVRRHLAESLAAMGPAAAVFAKDLLPLLNDAKSDVRTAAVQAFRQMGTAAAPYASDLLKKVDDADEGVRQQAFQALTQMGPEAAPVLASALLPLLQADHHFWNDPQGAVDACGNFHRDAVWQCAALSMALKQDRPAVEVQRLRCHLYLWSGHDAEMLQSVRWLGQPSADPMPAKGLSVAEQQAVLGMLLKLWPASAAHPALRREMAGRIGDVARGITTAPEPKVVALLGKLDAELKADAVEDSKEGSAKARAEVQRVLEGK